MDNNYVLPVQCNSSNVDSVTKKQVCDVVSYFSGMAERHATKDVDTEIERQSTIAAVLNCHLYIRIG